VYGTPAEELASPAAKTVMYNAGVFKGADVSSAPFIHRDSGTGAGSAACCMNINVVYYTSPALRPSAAGVDGRDALMA